MDGLNEREIVFFCVGHNAHKYDSLGPLVGTILKSENYKNVYGTLDESINGFNLDKYIDIIKEKHPNSFVIGVDLSITSKPERDLTVCFSNKGLSPGKGVGKKLTNFGDCSVLFRVSRDRFENLRDYDSFGIVYNGAIEVIKKIKEFLKFRRNSNMRKCKHCNTSNFGVILRKVLEVPATMVDGEIELIEGQDWEVVDQTLSEVYCNTCQKEIDETDIHEESCSICNGDKDVLNGHCITCREKINALKAILPNFSDDDLEGIVRKEIGVEVKEEKDKPKRKRNKTPQKKSVQKKEEVKEETVSLDSLKSNDVTKEKERVEISIDDVAKEVTMDHEKETSIANSLDENVDVVIKDEKIEELDKSGAGDLIAELDDFNPSILENLDLDDVII